MTLPISAPKIQNRSRFVQQSAGTIILAELMRNWMGGLGTCGFWRACIFCQLISHRVVWLPFFRYPDIAKAILTTGFQYLTYHLMLY